MSETIHFTEVKTRLHTTSKQKKAHIAVRLAKKNIKNYLSITTWHTLRPSPDVMFTRYIPAAIALGKLIS